jgi:2-polyprenyl-3-methyl-5-hydroxy-6-metoxy-1,4-benzoquinol methylase
VLMSTPAITAVSCNICGSTDFAVLFAAGVAQVNQIVECKRCGLMYANPRCPADHVRIESWEDDPAWDFERENPQRFEKERLQTRDYANTRALLSRLYPQRGSLVEVGSSTGSLLQTFHIDGWDVMGVEPDLNAARYATNKLGIRTIHSTLERSSIGDQSFDVAVLLHVIEHVPDPVATLQELYRILKPGGHLVVETPRYDTLMFKLLGRRERSLSCDGHIFFFTTDTLRQAYKKAGFELVQYENVGRSLTIDRLVHNLAIMSKIPTAPRVIGAVSRSLSFHKLSFTINVRDMQRVCLRKPISINSATPSH